MLLDNALVQGREEELIVGEIWEVWHERRAGLVQEQFYVVPSDEHCHSGAQQRGLIIMPERTENDNDVLSVYDLDNELIISGET